MYNSFEAQWKYYALGHFFSCLTYDFSLRRENKNKTNKLTNFGEQVLSVW